MLQDAYTPDQLTLETIAACLPRSGVALPQLHILDEIDSTNSYLKRIAPEGAADNTVAVADYQSGGRGRKTRTFQSPRGKGIYLSALFRPTLTPEQLMPVTALTAVAMCDAIEQVCGLRPQIKWTNDLLLNGKKIAGILTELVLCGNESPALIIGVGINVHQTAEDFTPDVAAMASSLSRELGRPVSRPQLIAAMISSLQQLRAALGGDTASWLAAYRRDCLTIGQDVQLLWSDRKETAFAEDVDDQFGLVIRYPDGRRETVRSGEVSVRGLYGYIESTK